MADMKNQIESLLVAWEAYQDANENDYCSDEHPDYEGCSPSDIISNIGEIIKRLNS